MYRGAAISLMVGRDLGNYYVRTFNELGQVVLEARNICAGKRAINCSFFRAKRRDTGFLRSGRCWPVGIDESCYGTGSFGFRRDISERRIGKKARPNVYAKKRCCLVP